MTCETCKYCQDDVCVNDRSDQRADFVDEDFGCDKWEELNVQPEIHKPAE